jgi:hypothetical protein
LTKQFELSYKTLECSYFPGEHTGENIFLKIKAMVNEWNIDISNLSIPIYIVTDNARNISCGLNTYNDNDTLHHYFCAAHTLQLAIEDSLKENNMGSLLKKCRSIVMHYNHSTKSWERLQQIQLRLNLPNHKLIQMVETRWNSVYLMLERIIEQREAIVLDLQNLSKDIDITLREWKLINRYVEILKPVLEATKEFSQEDIPTFSMVNPIIYSIEKKLDNFITKNSNTAAGIGFARSLRKSISNRFLVSKNDPSYLLATVIDPRFKTILMELENVEKVKSLLTIEVEKFGSACATLEISETEQSLLLPTTVPVSTNSLWDNLQERSTTSSTNKEQLISSFKKEVRSYIQIFLVY